MNVHVPLIRIEGKKNGPTLLVTAGNDGDEYAGIAAAYRLIEEFSKKEFAGTLIVIPIVNIPGFEAETSRNPLDGKFPKLLYPGSKNGSSSEKLRFWLSGIASTAQFWLDFHDGSLTERLIPFVRSYGSGNKRIDEQVMNIIQKIPVTYAACTERISMTVELARHGCGYLLAESGSFGNYNTTAINRHVQWAHVVMSELGMIDKKVQNVPKKIFRKISEYVIRKNGVWFSNFSENPTIQRGDVLGTVRSLEGKIIEQVSAIEDGILLWGKEGMRANSGDVVAGVGRSSQ